MAQQENKIPLSKKGKRDISPFVGHELLYDYLTGTLDKERRIAIEDHVKFSRDAQLDLAKIQSGQQYAEMLSETVVSQPIVEQINAPSSYLSVLMQKSNFEKWPQGLKWGLEALVVVVGIVVVLTVTPWQKVMQLGVPGSKDVVLAEVTKSGDTAPTESEKPEFIDEDVKSGKEVSTGKTAPSAVAAAPALSEKNMPAPTTPAPVVASPVSAAKEQTKAAVEAKTAAAESATPSSGGFLFRGSIAATNIAVIGPKITEKINELGGRKAGAVELGWQKTPNSMYYHFTIPEAKYQDLIAFLATYGKAKIAKEKHPRVMPDGIYRIIITLDEAQK